jgi:diacylglycerol kinase family enzyme
MQARIAPGADPSDGRFELVWVGPQPLWALVAGLPSLFRGKRLGFAEYGQVESVRLEAEAGAQVPYHVDGEPAGCLPIDVSLLKKRLRVIAPG